MSEILTQKWKYVKYVFLKIWHESKILKKRKNDYVRNIYSKMRICQIFISKNMTWIENISSRYHRKYILIFDESKKGIQKE